MTRIRQLLRYAAVSGVATCVSQVVLVVLVATRATSAVEANVIATMAGTIPSFELNRRWVWGKSGSRSLAKEVVPFSAISASGLLLSTLAVAAASRWAEASAIGDIGRTVAVQVANLSAFGVVWIAQFVVLDRVLFRSRPRRADHPLGFPECSMDELSRL